MEKSITRKKRNGKLLKPKNIAYKRQPPSQKLGDDMKERGVAESGLWCEDRRTEARKSRTENRI